MKKIILSFLILILALTSLGCSDKTPEVDFYAVTAAFEEAGYYVLGPSRPYRQTAFHAYYDTDEIWIFLHETNSDANTAWDAAEFFVLGRYFEGITMYAFREGRLVFYGTPAALEIFAQVRK